MMKYVLATIASYDKNQRNLTLDKVESLTTIMPILPSTSKDKGNFQNKVIGIFEKMAKNIEKYYYLTKFKSLTKYKCG